MNMSKNKGNSQRKLEEDQVRLFEIQASNQQVYELTEEQLANASKDPRHDQALIQTLINFLKKA